MTPARRPPVPTWYAANFERWRDRWLASHDWTWPISDGVRVNVRLIEDALRPMTDGHCAYCDADHLGAAARETIDHFRPKATFPAEAFDYENLYPACDVCQSAKRDTWDEHLLRPDEPGYDFDRYFVCDAATGLLTPNPGASAADQRRAERSITVFGLNRSPRPAARGRAWRSLDSDGPYRFLPRPR